MAILEKEDSGIQLVGFHVGQKFYGTDILSIQEILRETEIEKISQGPAFVEGKVRLRGATIPVINLRRRLGDSTPPRPEDNSWVLITNTEGIAVGFTVDKVTRIIKINSDAILPAPDLILEGLHNPYIRGVCTTEVGMLVVLDFKGILAADEISEIKEIGVRQVSDARRI